MDKIEQRAYGKGYATGRRKGASDAEEQFRSLVEYKASELASAQSFWDNVYCAALQGTLVDGTWKTNGERCSNNVSFCELAKNFADRALKIRRKIKG
ncbi:MAG: hypothetical protein V3R25_05725 [Nitrosomonadaceae bacterium]